MTKKKEPKYNKRLMDMFKIIGENIRNTRGVMSKVALAKKIEVSRSTLTAAEMGKNITLVNLIKIADGLGVHPSQFLIEDDEKLGTQITIEELCERIVEKKLRKYIQ